MRVVIQRVKFARVRIENRLHSEIGHGLLVLAGIENDDSLSDAEWLAQKISSLRIFSDEEGKMNKSVSEISGSVLLVSQFTLHASTKKGNRPSFIRAARPEQAIPLFEFLKAELQRQLEQNIQTGVFGADMQIELLNDGPVTIIIDSKNKE